MAAAASQGRAVDAEAPKGLPLPGSLGVFEAGWTLFAHRHLRLHQRADALLALDPLCHRALCSGICVAAAAADAAALSGGDWA